MSNIGKIPFIALMLLSLSGFSFAQNSSAIETSNSLYNYLLEKNFNPTKQLLANSDDFPYSIILNFNEQVYDRTQDINRFIIALPQNNSEHYLEFIDVLLTSLQDSPTTIMFTLALLANEPPPFTTENQWHPSGSQILLSNIPNPDSCALLLLEDFLSPKNDVSVVLGVDGQLTPLWLLRQIPLPIPHNSLITYRLNLAQDSQTLLPFFQAGMASVGIHLDLNNEEQCRRVFSAIDSMIKSFTAEVGVIGASKNYMVFSLVETVWIGEIFFILLYLFIAILILAILSGFSFLGKKGILHRQAFFKIWYLIPVTIFLSALFLFLGQKIASSIIDVVPKNTPLLMGIKTLFSFITISLPFIFHLHLRLSISQFVYGYLLTIVAAMNIFIFTSIDLLLLFIFLIEYLIIYLSRLVRKVIPLIICSFLMLLPFAPYAINIIEFASPEKLLGLVNSGIIGNILYACILTPFQIMWLRILVRLDIFGKHKHVPPLKRLAIVGFVMVVMVVSVILSIVIGSIVLYKSLPRISPLQNKPQEYQIVDVPQSVNFTVLQDSYLELRTVKISISSQLPIIRYNVRVKTTEKLPVYDSILDFQTVQTESGVEAHFLIPDYPTSTSSFEYTAASDMVEEVHIAVYVAVGENQASLVEKTITLPALRG